MARPSIATVVFLFFFRTLPLTTPTLWQRSPLVSSCDINGDDRMETLYGKSTSGSCAWECQRRKWCNSFLYAQLIGQCLLCSLHYVDTDVIIDTGTIKYYRATSDDCPMKDGYLLDRASGVCLLVMYPADQRVYGWQLARQGCTNRTLNLASLHTPSRLDFVMQSLRHNGRFHGVNYFIGAARPPALWGAKWPAGEPDFLWLGNGAAVDTGSQQDWASGQPDHQQQENVLALTGQSFQLSDVKDTCYPQRLGYICEK